MWKKTTEICDSANSLIRWPIPVFEGANFKNFIYIYIYARLLVRESIFFLFWGKCSLLLTIRLPTQNNWGFLRWSPSFGHSNYLYENNANSCSNLSHSLPARKTVLFPRKATFKVFEGLVLWDKLDPRMYFCIWGPQMEIRLYIAIWCFDKEDKGNWSTISWDK